MQGHLFRKKPISFSSHTSLKRSLNVFDLILMGIGAIIGAGVFVLTGIAAATQAGPAIVFSYIVAGLASLFAALAYAELAASVGGSGSAYSYAYAGFGELIAWIIGWNLILEYGMSIATVSIGWSGYMNNLFQALHVHIPDALTKDPFEGGVVNLLAVFIVFAIGLLLSIGTKLSAHFNAAIVFIKLLAIFIFIAVAYPHIDRNNWYPFMPFGLSGVFSGAALVFFAYIGFDALSTAVEEAHNPQRDIPISIITSLAICTLIYIIVSAILTGIVPYSTLNVRSPVSEALLMIGHSTAAGLISAGAIAGLTTVILVMYYGLTRICLAMARDGLLPKSIATIHTRTYSPNKIIFVVAMIVSIVAGLSPIGKVAELVNIGTLAAFVFVCAGVVVLRLTHPDLPRPFRLPFSPIIPGLGVFSCIYLMLYLPGITWLRFLIWTLVGIIIYFLYGKNHSDLQNSANVSTTQEPDSL